MRQSSENDDLFDMPYSALHMVVQKHIIAHSMSS